MFHYWSDLALFLVTLLFMQTWILSHFGLKSRFLIISSMIHSVLCKLLKSVTHSYLWIFSMIFVQQKISQSTVVLSHTNKCIIQTHRLTLQYKTG